MTIQRHAFGTLAASFLVVSSAAAVQAQGINLGGLLGGVGGLIQSGIQADAQRQQLEQLERIERLRLEQLRRQQLLQQQPARSVYAPPPQEAGSDADNTPFAEQDQVAGYRIEGRRLGDVADFAASDPAFGCSGSEQFPGFQWCKRLKPDGKLSVQTAVLTSASNTIAYYAKAYAPAHFKPGSIDREIAKLSSHYGAQARVIRLAPSGDGSGAVIASWGALTLAPVGAAIIQDLAANKQLVAGVLVDFLGDARQSARQGLPVYRVSGGAGAFWAARFDRKGQGNLRFGLADASVFDHAPTASLPALAAAPVQSPPVIVTAEVRTTAPPASPVSPSSVAPLSQPPLPPAQPASPAVAAPPPAAAVTAPQPAFSASQPAAPTPQALAMVVSPPTTPQAAAAAPQPVIPPPPMSPVVAQEAATPLPAAHGDKGADQRVALVIGNSAYRAVARLPNPDNDAEAVAGVLRSEGFTVKLVEDATLAEMKDALRNFQAQADNADWAVVYYAGHGIEISGQNYLIPVDAKLGSDQDADDEAVTLRYVLDKMHNARKLHLVILDACRDNPFQGIMKRQIAARGVARGLAPYEPSIPSEMVVYAARGGEQAQDDVGTGGHSPFAKALVARMAVPGVELNKVFRLVTADVLADTHNRQQPFVYGSTPGVEDFYFRAD